VAWLVRSLADEGETLRAGQMVFTGGLTAPFDLVASRRYELVSEHLTAVHATVGSPPDP
jgi:2-keto-4-pentenoate hydratase